MVYPAGLGRSGSTLLKRLLGEMPGACLLARSFSTKTGPRGSQQRRDDATKLLLPSGKVRRLMLSTLYYHIIIK